MGVYGGLRTIFWGILCVLEVFVSIVVHASYALSIIFSAIWIDIKTGSSSSPQHSAKVTPLIEAAEQNTDYKGVSNFVVADTGSESLSAAGAFFDGHEKAPIVLVHGLFGFGKGKLGTLSYWGGAEQRDDRILVPDLGALSSIHDRIVRLLHEAALDLDPEALSTAMACELFYYLKGGIVDFGLERSKKFGHSRFGHTYRQGHYPDWDDNHPIHFVGHSTGVQVIRVLQHMLAQKAFPGHSNTSADWVLSVTSVSGVLNGTTRVYFDGIRPEDGRTMKSFSLLQFLRVAVLLYEWLDVPFLKRYYDFGFDHYSLQWHKAGFKGLWNTILNRTGPFADGNWVLPDLSIQHAVELNKNLETYESTYYFSYATKGTRKFLSHTVPRSFLGTHPLLFLRALQIAFWRHPQELPAPCDGYRDEDWQDNDGALNTISQLYPRLPYEHPHCQLGTGFKDGQVLRPGIWYFTTLQADHIYFIVNRDRAGVHFDVLYDSIFQRCRKQLRRHPKVSKVQAICVCDNGCVCNGYYSKQK